MKNNYLIKKCGEILKEKIKKSKRVYIALESIKNILK